MARQSPAAVTIGRDAVTRDQLANAIRALSMDAVEAAKSGHPGMPMGMADAAVALFADHLKFCPDRPDWPDRDRFVLSAGHGSMLLYALLHLTGYRDMTMAQIRRFRQLGSVTAGHPEYGHAGGVETTTGPLGQGFANAVGMALAERRLAARFGRELVDHYTYCIAGDGCLMEGISHEAASLAGHLRLSRLILLFDDNGITIDGPAELSVSDDHAARFCASGWDVQTVDGHDPAAVSAAIAAARTSDRPSFIACRTTIGFGAPAKGGTAAAHGAPLGAEEIAGARARLGWPYPPFEIPGPVAEAWRAIGVRGRAACEAWQERLRHQPDAVQTGFRRALAGDFAGDAAAAVAALKPVLTEAAKAVATRAASATALEAITASVPELVGGSADLTGSNNTRVARQTVLGAGNPAGDYIHYGVREHAMAAAMNGMALHGGMVPYGGTFLAFTDYCRPAIRLAALMRLRVVFVMTHDSIGLGEDGPTHQPVEHLAALRAMPNLNVYRPADAVETAECWAAALATPATPSILALSRQSLAPVRQAAGDDNLCARGGYVLADSGRAERAVTLIATGSEVALALAARERLEAAAIGCAVVSMPCQERFDAQPRAWREAVLPPDAVTVAVEAGVRQGWDRYLGRDGGFVGMDGFGASAPAADLFRHFGITEAAVEQAARDALARR